MKPAISLAVATALIATPVAARDKVYALPSAGATASYDRGIPTVQIVRANGIVQLTPIGMDHGGMTFVVTVFNNSDRPINFDLSNIQAGSGGQPIRPMSVDELIRKAKNRAFWRSVGIGLLGGLAVGLASSRNNTYYSSYRSLYGSSYTVIRYPSIAGQIEAANLSVATGYALTAIDRQLSQTREMLSDQIVQTTTLQPGDSYAGRVVLAKLPGSGMRNVDVTINWNDEIFPFTLRLQDDNAAPPPPIETLTLRPRAPAGASAQASGPGYASAAYASLPTGAKPINGGYLQPAKTASGYCIVAGSDYRGAGTSDMPAVTGGMPRC